ncbi:macrolide family glycosyltransferase [Paenibacillus sp. M1]|uniref:Macrolide family glycosyltransferase n=1 Tax=Paenibacillus haidiansis TaxID=1574488 RepID=A0ABU7VQW3_9BACL
MARVLFINGPASGHVNPTLGLVEELITHGEEIVYVSSEEYRSKLERLGAAFVAYGNFLAGAPASSLGGLMPLSNLILSSYDIILPCIREISETRTFDYLIHDSMYGCGNIVAGMLRLPHVATCTSFVYSERMSGGSSGDEDMRESNRRYVKEFMALARQMEAKYKIRSKLQIQNVFFNPGDLNLLFTSRELQPEADTLDESYRFVGPSIHDRGEPLDFPLEKKPGQRTVYISLGTVFNEFPQFYALCFEALRDFDGLVIVSVGKNTDIAGFGVLPEHFIIRPHVPQLAVLQEADLFITHGGMNSVHEALYFDVPLIVVPMAADQPAVAGRIEALGAGRMLDAAALTPELLRACVDEILTSEHYRLGSARIGRSLREAGGQQAAVREIMRFKRKFGIL